MEEALVREIRVIPTVRVQERWHVFTDDDVFPVLQVTAELFQVLIKFVA